MTKKIRIKRRKTGAAGPPASLLNAELAFNEVSNVLYYAKGEAENGLATAIIPIGGNGAFVALTGAQTVGGAKTFLNTVAAVTPPLTDNSALLATTEFVKQQYYLKPTDVIDGGLLVGAAGNEIISTETGAAIYAENYTVLTV